MKNLFNKISQDEKNRILEMHSVKKNVISEQRSDYAMDAQSNAIARSSGIRNQKDYDDVNRMSHMPNKIISQEYVNLVNILDNARNSSWKQSITKTLFNDKDDLYNLGVAITGWTLKNPNYNPTLLIASIAALFRESKASPAMLFKPKEILGLIHNIFGGDRSQGFAQIKPSTAKRYGISEESLYSYAGSLDAVYKILSQNYTTAKQYYNGPTVTIFKNNKLFEIPAIGGDAALHMAIASHNAGEGILGEWCQTNIPNIANKCNITNRVLNEQGDGSAEFRMNRLNRKQLNFKPTTSAITNKNKKIKNYFPNISGLHNYMPQFAIAFNNLTQIPKVVNQLVSSTKQKMV